jgi:diguanylate cyclase (GGDEF)-like protein
MQGVIAAVVVSYGLSTFVVHRPPSGYNTIWDGWDYTIAETLPVIPMLLRARRSPEFRSAWLAMAAGVALNTVGDLVYTYHDQNLKPVPNPAPSDAFYLLSYAALIVGVAVLTQSAFGRVHPSVRLDGAIAGLALAAVAGMAWFEPLLRLSGRPLQVGVALAYPVCDLVLVVLLVAGLAPHHYRPNWPTVLLMAGVLWSVAGDVVYLRQSTAGTYVPGKPLDATWVIGFFFMGLAASARDRRRSAGPRAPVSSPRGITVVPVFFGVLSLGVIALARLRRDSSVVVSLAPGALGFVIARMWLTLRELRQMAAREQHQSALNYEEARTDYLTGLPNRRAFLERAQSAFFSQPGPGEGSGGHVGVLLVDLDGFKEVNDALGHGAGDELLCVVARRFEHRLGGRGVLARLGGDEYAFACPVEAEEDLVAMAQELCDALSGPCVLDGVSVRVGASIGVAVSRPDDLRAGKLLRCADVAMYKAKRAQCGVAVYRAEDDPNGRDRLALLDALRDAINNRELVLHYQPTLDMRTAAVHGVEALVRWPHPTLGLLYPDAFISLAERSALMPQLTRAVLDLAVAQAAQLDRAGYRLYMSVNISRYDLVDEDLPGYIDRVLALYRFPHERLTLEITESAFGGDPELARRCVAQLRGRGLRVSIDDFGVGYSSMSQLLGSAIDELKIDKSFVLGLDSDPRAQAIARSAIELARALGLTVVAEGIEREEVLRSLHGIGADIGQGYVIAHPLTSAQLEAYLAQTGQARRLRADFSPLLAGPTPLPPFSSSSLLSPLLLSRERDRGAEAGQ